jgi:hypothetical protein
MVTFRITVVREANGTYVLGNGSAFGVDVAPNPAAWDVSRAGVVEVEVPGPALAHALAARRERQKSGRM